MLTQDPWNNFWHSLLWHLMLKTVPSFWVQKAHTFELFFVIAATTINFFTFLENFINLQKVVRFGSIFGNSSLNCSHFFLARIFVVNFQSDQMLKRKSRHLFVKNHQICRSSKEALLKPQNVYIKSNFKTQEVYIKDLQDLPNIYNKEKHYSLIYTNI